MKLLKRLFAAADSQKLGMPYFRSPDTRRDVSGDFVGKIAGDVLDNITRFQFFDGRAVNDLCKEQGLKIGADSDGWDTRDRPGQKDNITHSLREAMKNSFPPYPRTFIEWPTTCIVFSYEGSQKKARRKFEWITAPGTIALHDNDEIFTWLIFCVDRKSNIFGVLEAGASVFRNKGWLGALHVAEMPTIDCCSLAFFTLLGCKNIQTRDVFPAEALQRKRRKLKKRPLVTHKILELILPGTKKNHESGEVTNPGVPLHLCRGHFKCYTKEKPLLGRFTGTYWWSPHVRGDKKYGEVHKTYKTKRENTDEE